MNIKDTLSLSESGVSQWYSVREQTIATLVISIPDGPEGTFVIEGSNDSRVIDRERAAGVDPADSVAVAADITALWSTTATLATNGTARTIALRCSGPTDFIRVSFTYTDGDPDLFATIFVSATSAETTTGSSSFTTQEPPDQGVGDVRRYVSGGVLTNDNIDAAIEAALAAAIAFVTASNNGGYYQRADVYVPPGIYFLADRHDFPSSGNGKPMVGLDCGEDPHAVLFIVNSDAGDWVFTFGDDSGVSLTPEAYELRVRGFSVVGIGGAAERSGIKFSQTYHARIEHLRVYGFSQAQSWDKGWGIYFAENGQGNHQHLAMRDVRVQEVTVGYYLRNIWSGNIRDCDAHGCWWANIMHDSCRGLEWSGGDLQMGVFPAGDYWHSGRTVSCSDVSTGITHTTGLESGTGATCGAATSGLCTVSGISPALNPVLDRARWIELTPTGAASANKTKVGGVYKIYSVAENGLSCVIHKGSNHTSQADCDYQIRGHYGGSSITFTGQTYDESGKGTEGAVFFFGRDEAGSSVFSVRDALSAGAYYCVDADGAAVVNVTNVAPGNGKLRIRQVNRTTADLFLQDIHFDDHSKAGLVCRANPQQTSLHNGLVDSRGGRSKRVRQLVKELGAVEAWDARMPGKFTLATLAVNSWTGYILGRNMVYNNASAKPQYVAADVSLGACVQITGGAGDRGMNASLLAASLPSFPHTGSVFAVLRLGSAAAHTAGGARRINMYSPAAGYEVALDLNDVSLSVHPWGGHIYDGANHSSNLGAGVVADTDAHALLISPPCELFNTGVQFASDFQSPEYVSGGAITKPTRMFVPGNDIEVNIAPPYGANVDEFFISFLAVFPRALTEAEGRQLIDAARHEWPLWE